MSRTTDKGLHELFEVSIMLKGIFALGETLGGILLFFVSTTSITNAITYFSQGELGEDPNDPLIHLLLHTAHSFSIGGKTFAALYLLSHGIVKLALVTALFMKKTWAYPASLAVLVLFIIYQLYQFGLSHSFWYIALTIFDLVVIGLIWNEYRMILQHNPVED
jgi:uncharacterized membrane protein